MTQQETLETLNEAIDLADKNSTNGLGDRLYEVTLTLQALWGIKEDE